MSYSSHITVAAVIENDGSYLMVKEMANGLEVYNQPAGHWEINETFIQASVRETLEETAWDYEPEAIVGIYRWPHPQEDSVFVRTTFCGKATHFHPELALDQGIIKACWMTRAEIEALDELQRRSALVLKSIEDYENGIRYSLDLLTEVKENW